MPIDVSRVKSSIVENLRGIHTLHDIASQLAVSPETLRREFFRKEGIHVSEFVMQVRMEEMKRLLAETEMRCFEIAYQVGFSREDSAATVFKRYTGMTMEAYRKLCKKHE